MNKRVGVMGLIFVGFLSGILINHGYAQEYTEADMKAVTVRFCGEGTGATTHDGIVYIEPGKEKNLCLYVSNGGNKKVAFEYGFSESGIGKGRYCQSDMGTGNRFSILIPWTKERKITIDPMTAMKIEEKIVIPPGMSGVQLGCLAYKLGKPENTLVGGMFSLIIRKVGYLDIIVGGESEVKSTIKLLDIRGGAFSTSRKIKAEVDEENNLKLSFLVENQGNIAQSVTITGKIYNALGFQKDFIVTTNKVAPGSKNEFNTDAGILPSYKGFFTVKFYVKGDPQFMFPISNEELKKPIYISEQGQIFMFSRIRVIVLIVLLLVLYKIIIPRKAKEVK